MSSSQAVKLSSDLSRPLSASGAFRAFSSHFPVHVVVFLSVPGKRIQPIKTLIQRRFNKSHWGSPFSLVSSQTNPGVKKTERRKMYLKQGGWSSSVRLITTPVQDNSIRLLWNKGYKIQRVRQMDVDSALWRSPSCGLWGCCIISHRILLPAPSTCFKTIFQ